MAASMLGTFKDLAISLGCLGFVCSGGARAQQSPESNENSESQEIVVTAQRRAEASQDVPISLAVFGRQFIQDSGATDLDDITRFTPNARLEFGRLTPQNNRLTIRGLTSNTSNSGIDPSVAVFLDGVYVARVEAVSTDFIDVERVEVLRGPQGTLYGKNSSTGAVNIITRTPSDSFAIEADMTYGRFNFGRARATVSGPLIADTLQFSASGFGAIRDGSVRNRTLADDINDVDRSGVRGKLRFTPTERLTMTLAGDYQIDNVKGVSADISVLSGVPRDIFDYEVEHNQPEGYRRRAWGLSLTADYEITSSLTLTSITAFRDTLLDIEVDIDYTAVDNNLSQRDNGQDQFSQEMRLVSDYQSKVNFVIGLYFFQSDTGTDSNVNVFRVVPSLRSNVTNIFRQNAKSYAAYGQATYRPREDVRLAAGLRLNREEKTASVLQTTLGPVGAAFPKVNVEQAREEDDLSFTLTAGYDPTPDIALYATIASGSKAGGFNGELLTNVRSLEFDPEESLNYEVGVKSRLLDRMTLNVSGFYTTFKNLQVSSFNGTNFDIANAAEATSYGIEADTAIDFGRAFSIQAALGWNVAKYDDYPNAPVPGVTGATQNLAGKVLQNAPRWSASVAAQYEPELGSVRGLARVEYFYTDDQFLSQDLDPNNFQSSYNLVNVRLGVRSPENRWSVAMFVTNLLEEEYKVQSGPVALAVRTYAATPGEQRIFGLELRGRY